MLCDCLVISEFVKAEIWADKVAHQVKVLAVKQDVLSLILRTYVTESEKQLLKVVLLHVHYDITPHTHTYIHTHMHTHIK